MPYDVSWYNEDQTILKVHIHGVVTWEGWYDAVERIVAIIGTGSHQVDLMYVDEAGLPQGRTMPHLQRGLDKLWSEPQLGQVVVVTQPGIGLALRVVIVAVLRAFRMAPRRSAYYVVSVEEALAYIQKKRSENGAHT